MNAPKQQAMSDDVPSAVRRGDQVPYAKARRYHYGLGQPIDDYYTGKFNCKGCSPFCIYWVNLGCCLWGIWGCCGCIPSPLGCVATTCLCEEGGAYIAQKSGVKTGELLIVDAEEGTLAWYGGCGGVAPETPPSCYCTK
mmetsp:Transcript_1087/g.4364  ORF Transcript_1087/g.4364 Transcript_1087/m.4364 type:complete len:139 (+) Transcript_1087:65-481(+)